ncbi:hypothetical protein, partial [Escherichia coli]|uniref:hypothetical protein n=2 Tax=Escherichia coli TaxID=562 RepID=UPI000AF533AB
MNSLQILSFVGFTLLVAVITWWKVRKTDTGSQQGYFLAGVENNRQKADAGGNEEAEVD